MVSFPSSTRDFLENLVRISFVRISVGIYPIPHIGEYVSVGENPLELLLLLKFGFFASSLLDSFQMQMKELHLQCIIKC